jgi:glutamine amidotransferase-like uncharacterized protein
MPPLSPRRALVSAAVGAVAAASALPALGPRPGPAAPLRSSARCPLTDATSVAVYADEAGGVGPGSHAWTAAFFAWWAAANPGALVVTELTAAALTTDCALTDFPGLRLYVQPGGDAFNASQALGPSGRDNLLNYLFYITDAHYMGTCAGWYYASGSYWWKDAFVGDFYFTPHLFPTVEGDIPSIAAYPSYAPTGVVDASTGDAHTHVYYGGPTLGLNHTAAAGNPGATLATFADVAGAGGARLVSSVTHGRLLLHSTHPEAVEGVHRACDPPAPPGCLTRAQRLANWRWLAAAINAHVGADWVIPNAL